MPARSTPPTAPTPKTTAGPPPDVGTAFNYQGRLKVDGVLGIGYTSIESEIDFQVLPDVDGDESWVDPLFGLRTRWHFSEHWGGMMESFVGGFGLLGGSDLFTMFSLFAGRKLGDNKYLYAGWRSLDLDYEDGPLDVDVRVSGPIIGLEIHL